MSLKSNDNFMSSRMLLQQLRNAKPTTKVGARVLKKVYIVFKKHPYTVKTVLQALQSLGGAGQVC
eukprot:scaffold11810_cov126-Skeletonema_dohrnii-CCMP3373.AAC.2